MNPPASQTDIEVWRNQHYNATVVGARRIHDEQLILRVQPDAGRLRFQPGQYTLLGLGVWEPRSDGITNGREGDSPPASLIRRAYSVGCPLLEDGRLVTTSQIDFLEFDITLVSKTTDEPPPLTPRLFALREGDRLFLGQHAHGHYTLDYLQPDDDVVFFGTGTGEAPHNAMIAELLGRGHRGRICCCTCARYLLDLPYLEIHRELERRFPNYRYFALTTREPENIDSSHPQYTGKQYLQDFLCSGSFEEQARWTLDPARAHVYLCGNPAMIGLPRKAHDGHPIYPEPPGMVEALVNRGFRIDEPRNVGNVHFEKYW